MSINHTAITDDLYAYILDISLREHPTLQKLRTETSKHKLAAMQSSPDQAQLFQFLLKTIRARKVLEIGTFTGYCTLAMALALPEDGKVITCDANAEWTKDNHKFWQEAGQLHKIQLQLQPALTTLDKLIADGNKESFDFIFIDADKANYDEYYKRAFELINSNGIIAIENVLWHGDVIDINNNKSQTKGIRRLNTMLKNDNRVDISLLTVADGLFLVRKKQK